MVKPEPRSGEMDLENGSMVELLEAFRGCNVFVKTACASNAFDRKGRHACGMALPHWFVEDNKERLCKEVVLVTNKGQWNLKFAFSWQHRRQVPKVQFSGGWGAFAMSNSLTFGEHLLFKLFGLSHFHVYIFNSDGTPKAAMLPKKAPVVTPMECESDPRKSKKARTSESEKAHPSFSKRLPLIKINKGLRVSSLEIPSGFTKTHGGKLRTMVTLQGISPESPQYNIACSWGQDTSKILRLFFKYGWTEFWDANHLEEGQELQFTLTSDSTFIVRERTK